MALLLALPARGEEFGRLFTTSEERTLLERLRYAPATEVKEKEETLESVVPKADVPPSITLNGIVSRSGGNSTMWINGLNTQSLQVDNF